MFGNMMLHKALEESGSNSKNKVTIGAHNLDCEASRAATASPGTVTGAGGSRWTCST